MGKITWINSWNWGIDMSKFCSSGSRENI
jgi:hypothetical protein